MTASNTNYSGVRVTDAHVHFWDPQKLPYPWLDGVPKINKPFGLAQYQAATQNVPISSMIFVQCECLPEQYLNEVAYITQLAAQDDRIRGIVSYFPLEALDAEERLSGLLSNPLIRGIRRLEEEPVSLYKNPMFINNMDLLQRHRLPFDLCVQSHQLAAALELITAKPDVHYMLDHFGKPAIKTDGFNRWKKQLAALAKNPRVYCKLSGLVTEADWENWTIADLQPYADVALECFSADRLVFGGDWPVVTLASDYDQWYNTAHQLCHTLNKHELNKVFYQNALDFYKITESTSSGYSIVER